VTTFHGSDVVVPWQKLISMVVSRLTTPIFVAESQRHALRLDHGEVIPAAVDAEIFAPRDRFEARRALGWDVQRSYVLFPASRSNRVKRADVFDAAIAIATRQISDLVGMSLDGLAREEVALAMNAADVVLLPSDSEGSPVSVREALACETPVVATPVGDLGEVLAGLPAGGTAPQEPQALAQLVIGAVGVNRTGALRQRALQFARERTAERIADVYRRVVETSEPSVHSHT
jgi:glycosyltransferase involved in cell wall biosynthesis